MYTRQARYKSILLFYQSMVHQNQANILTNNVSGLVVNFITFYYFTYRYVIFELEPYFFVL